MADIVKAYSKAFPFLHFGGELLGHHWPWEEAGDCVSNQSLNCLDWEGRNFEGQHCLFVFSARVPVGNWVGDCFKNRQSLRSFAQVEQRIEEAWFQRGKEAWMALA